MYFITSISVVGELEVKETLGRFKFLSSSAVSKFFNSCLGNFIFFGVNLLILITFENFLFSIRNKSLLIFNIISDYKI